MTASAEAAVNANLAGLVDADRAGRAEATAFIAAGKAVSYRELDDGAARFAGLLAARGVQAGDRVALLLPNIPAFAEAYYGALRLGAIVVPLNMLLVEPEIVSRLEHSGSSVLVAEPGRECGAVPHIDPAEARSANAHVGLAQVEGSETAVLLYTSGTTGHPKAAELSHAGLAWVATQLGAVLDIGPGDVVFGAAPLAHVFGQSAVLNMTIAAGASAALVPRFDAAAALELIEREGVSVFLGVPTMCIALLRASEETGKAPAMRVAHSGGAPLAVETLRAFVQRFDCAVLEGYGLSETAGTVTSHRAGRPVKLGSVGEPIDGTEVRIDGPTGEIGEVLVRGPAVMTGYWHDEEASREAISPDGWFATGDVGYVDEDGYLFLVDRKKDVILRGGYTVYPREVEEALYEHPAVREAVSVGVPDETLGEEVAALVVLRDGAEATPAELIAFTRERVALYKAPRLVVVAPELPHGPTGKVLRRQIDRAVLRELLNDQKTGA
jgi:long-chain acyl-CoA synthetase